MFLKFNSDNIKILQKKIILEMNKIIIYNNDHVDYQGYKDIYDR